MLSTSARRALAPVAAGVAGAPSALPVLGASRILSLAVSRSFATSAPASADANILPARAASTSRAAYRPPSVNHVALDAISKGKTTGARFWNEGLFKSIGRAKGGLVPATAGATGAGQGLVPRAEQPEKKKSFDQLWAERSQMLQTQVQARDPYYGRSVDVVGGEVQIGYRRLTAILRRNVVPHELRRAGRHERKGDKRRRLSSQRWRMRFAHEVRKKVQMVQAIRRRGG